MTAPDVPQRTWLRDAIEAAATALSIALCLKIFVLEAYRIPSGSMEPTLFGFQDGQGAVKDRILVDRFVYLGREPARHEVAVFTFPLDRSRTFVKRVWGLPGETLRLWRGDVQRLEEDGNWAPLRRPQRVQEELWRTIARPDRWGAEGGARHDPAKGAIDFTEAGTVLYPASGEIRNATGDGYPPALADRVNRSAGSLVVGDLRATCTFELDEGASLTVTLGPEGGRATATLNTGGAALSTEGAQGIDVRAPVDLRRSHRLSLQRLDGQALLTLDGETVATLPVADVEPRASSIRLIGSAGARVGDLRIARDVHYGSAGTHATRWTVPEDHYFMLGDNAATSGDSRAWRLAGYRSSAEDGTAGPDVLGHRDPGRNPRTSFAEDDGPVWYFRDQWGERHRFPARQSEALPPTPAPFVPADHIVGRALITFWPLGKDLDRVLPRWVR